MPNKTGLCLGAYNEKRSEHVLTWRGLDFSRSTRVRPRFRRGDRRHDQPSRELVAVVPSDDATSMTRGDSGGQLTLGCPGSVARSDHSGGGGGVMPARDFSQSGSNRPIGALRLRAFWRTARSGLEFLCDRYNRSVFGLSRGVSKACGGRVERGGGIDGVFGVCFGVCRLPGRWLFVERVCTCGTHQSVFCRSR